jgi:hypothetical protein
MVSFGFLPAALQETNANIPLIKLWQI